MTTTAALAVRASDHMRPDDRERLNTWLASLGVDPTLVVALIVVGNGDGWDLHVSERVVDERGRGRLDLALDRPVTRPAIVRLGAEKTWPDVTTWAPESQP